MASSRQGRPHTPPSLVREIAASDDEGSDGSSSDDSLKDLTALLGGARGPPRSSADQHPATPPRSKRAAAGSSAQHRSPLAIIPRHRFDIKALAKDARRDTALQASSQLARVPVKDRPATPCTPGGSGSDITGLVSSASKPGDAQKVLRAVQRADPGHQELRYCFFRPCLDELDCPPPRRPPPPPEAKSLPWTLLTEENQRVREQNLLSGLPFGVVKSQGGMPPSVFLWILEEICAPGGSSVVRAELRHLVAACPKQVTALLTPALLQSMWECIGVVDASLDRKGINVAKVSEDVYKGRDWAPLLAILSILQRTSAALPLETRTYTLQLLLRMAMDKVVLTNIDIDDQFERTFKTLIETIPPKEWDAFCYDTCTLLGNFSSQCIRINALLCLPTSCSRAHDLRRRLAAAFLFRDASLARRAPEAAITLQAIINRLDEPDFDVGPGTEFAELRAAMLILDMVIDDGSVLVSPSADAGAEDRFNALVDELAARLSDIWRRINDTGMKLARTEAKSVVEWVQKRVAHTVRTRRRPPTSIFDLPGQKQQQRKDLPRQQEFMKSFFRKKMPSPKPTPKQEPEPKSESKSESESEEIVLDTIVVKTG